MWYIMSEKTPNILNKVGATISTVLCITVTSLITAYYLNKEDTTTFEWDVTLSGCVLIFGGISSIMSVITAAMAWMKRDISSSALTYARNFLTGLLLVFISLLYAFTSSDELITGAFWSVIVLRISDIMVDVGNPLEVQCGDTNQKSLGGKTCTIRDIKNIFVGLLFIAVLTFNGIYVTDEYTENDTSLFEGSDADEHAADRLLLTVFVLVSVHLLLLILRIVLQVSDSCQMGMMKFLKCLSCKQDQEICDEERLYMINEIPLVSKLVFTANLVCMGLLIGERIESNKPVHVLIWSISALGFADFISRNLI